jgi:hypothetical protein
MDETGGGLICVRYAGVTDCSLPVSGVAADGGSCGAEMDVVSRLVVNW